MAAVHAQQAVALSHSLQQREAGCLALWSLDSPTPCSLCNESPQYQALAWDAALLDFTLFGQLHQVPSKQKGHHYKLCAPVRDPNTLHISGKSHAVGKLSSSTESDHWAVCSKGSQILTIISKAC